MHHPRFAGRGADLQFRAGNAPWQGRGIRVADPDFRQAAACLHAPVDRRRARSALGPHASDNGLIAPYTHTDTDATTP
nr:hypothetical protein [uncultured Achromobacter sp.]